MTQPALGALLITIGTVVLVIAAFFPAYLAYIPGLRWFWPWGPRASRFGSAVGAGSCIMMGLLALGAIPKSAMGVVITVWVAVVVAAALHDFALAADAVARPPTPKSRGKRGLRKRRK